MEYRKHNRKMTTQRFYMNSLKLFHRLKELYPSTTTFYQAIRQHKRKRFSIHLFVESGKDGCEIYDATIDGDKWDEDKGNYYEILGLDEVRPVIDDRNLVVNAEY